MEFFIFLKYIFQLCDPAIQVSYGINVLPVWTAFSIAGGLYAVVYVFKAIGLLVMAKKQGKTKLAWCAFIPFASTFLLGELAGELRFGSVKVKHLGIIAMVMELIYTFSGVFVIGWQANLISGGSYIVERVLNNAGDVIWYTTVFEGVSQQLQTLLNVFSVIKLVFKFVQLIAFIFLNIAFFPQVRAAFLYLDGAVLRDPSSRGSLPRIRLPQPQAHRLRRIYEGAGGAHPPRAAGAVRALRAVRAKPVRAEPLWAKPVRTEPLRSESVRAEPERERAFRAGRPVRRVFLPAPAAAFAGSGRQCGRQ